MVRTMSTSDAIVLEGLGRSFGNKRVLQGIDLRVPQGQVFGYLGPNGAGKSTTVRILVGMLGGFEGRAVVAGHDVAREPKRVKQRIGYVPENATLYESLTVFEHLLLVGRLFGLDDDLITARGGAFLDAFDLTARLHSRIGSLSKGMRQKVVISSAMLHDPEILFLDEPLSGLDVHSTVLIKTLIRSLADTGRTIFYCSHMMDVVERVCDRIVILHGGAIAADGDVRRAPRAEPGRRDARARVLGADAGR